MCYSLSFLVMCVCVVCCVLCIPRNVDATMSYTTAASMYRTSLYSNRQRKWSRWMKTAMRKINAYMRARESISHTYTLHTHNMLSAACSTRTRTHKTRRNTNEARSEEKMKKKNVQSHKKWLAIYAYVRDEHFSLDENDRVHATIHRRIATSSGSISCVHRPYVYSFRKLLHIFSGRSIGSLGRPFILHYILIIIIRIIRSCSNQRTNLCRFSGCLLLL